MKKLLSFSLLAIAAMTGGVQAADFPIKDKPVTIVVPFAAGGPTDRVARDLAEAMRKPLVGSIARRKKSACCAEGGRTPSGSLVATSRRTASTSSMSGCTRGSSLAAGVGGAGLGVGLGRQTRSGTPACAMTSSVTTAIARACSATHAQRAQTKNLSGYIHGAFSDIVEVEHRTVVRA